MGRGHFPRRPEISCADGWRALELTGDCAHLAITQARLSPQLERRIRLTGPVLLLERDDPHNGEVAKSRLLESHLRDKK